jgi:RNA polymerase sigma-70 factor (ECF subfamily)
MLENGTGAHMSDELSPRNEEGLIRDCERGDRSAFGRLLTLLRLEGAYRAKIEAIVRDPATVDDVYQEALLRLWRALSNGRFRRASSLTTFFFSIVTRVAYSTKSKQDIGREREERGLRGLLEEFASKEKPPLEGLISKERAEVFRIAVANLPAIYQSIVYLRCFDGMTYKEASRLLGVPEGTLRRRFWEALQLLGEPLSNYDVEKGQFHALELTYDQFRNLGENERSRRLQEFEKRNGDWLRARFDEHDAAWIKVREDGEIQEFGESMQTCPSNNEWMLAWEKGTFWYVFVHPSVIASEESEEKEWSPIHPRQYPIPTIEVTFLSMDPTKNEHLPVRADLDTCAIATFADADWLQSSGVVDTKIAIKWETGTHLGATYVYTRLEVDISFTDAYHRTVSIKYPIMCVKDWANGPFVKINRNRRVLVGRGVLFQLETTIHLNFREHRTEIQF